LKSLFLKYYPFLLVIFPCLLAELLGALTVFSGKYLIAEYLLRLPERSMEMSRLEISLIIILEITYVTSSLLFLLPIFKVYKNLNTTDTDLLLKAKTRIYNFPAFLIISVWILNVLEHCLFLFLKPEFVKTIPFSFIALVSTIVTAVIIYYSCEFLNRFVLIPHWFPDGKIKVKWKIHVPSLFLRFGDTFLVSGILPIIAILGILLLTLSTGVHDEKELERIFYVCLVVGGIFWTLGGLLTFLNSKTFLSPIASMQSALTEFSEGKFATRIIVHSDDALGVLEAAVNQMGEELEEKEIIKTIFGHYVSPAVRDLILGGKVNTDGDRIEAVILFTDIRSFTALSENHAPERIVKLLNIHFTRIVDIVSRNDGFVDKFIGDAVMAVFDEELTRGHHRLSALRAAAGILKELEDTNTEIAELGFAPIKIGIGMAAGPVIRGNIGSENRREMTVIGDTVNLASRLESATKEFGSPILMTESSFDTACADFKLIKKISEEALSIRGKSNLVRVFALDLA